MSVIGTGIRCTIGWKFIQWRHGLMCFLAVWTPYVLNSCVAICNRKYNRHQRNELNIHLILSQGCRQHTLTLARTYWMNSQILKFRSWSSKQFDDTSRGGPLGPQKQMVMDLPLECWWLYFSSLVTCHWLPGRQGRVPNMDTAVTSLIQEYSAGQRECWETNAF